MVRSSTMRATAYRFRVTFGQRWGDYLTLIVLIGLLGGVALGAIAGARRTQSSYVTYLGTIHPSDVGIFTAFANPSVGGSVGYDSARNAALLRLPYVRSAESIVGFDGNLAFVRGEHLHIQPGEKPPVFEGAQGGEYTTQDIAHLVAGRLADPRNPHEAVMNSQAAAEMGLRLGSVIQVGLNSDAQETAISSPTGPSSLPAARVATVKIVGLVVLPQDVDENDYQSLSAAEVLFTPAETRQIDTCCAYYSNSARWRSPVAVPILPLWSPSSIVWPSGYRKWEVSRPTDRLSPRPIVPSNPSRSRSRCSAAWRSCRCCSW